MVSASIKLLWTLHRPIQRSCCIRSQVKPQHEGLDLLPIAISVEIEVLRARWARSCLLQRLMVSGVCSKGRSMRNPLPATLPVMILGQNGGSGNGAASECRKPRHWRGFRLCALSGLDRFQSR